jgi:adenosylcobinamide-GDP ribazoletransferase
MGALADALVAFRYLTVLPLPAARAAGDLGRAGAWFPVVGAVLGGLLALGSLALDWLLPPVVAAMVLVILWVALTGGLHLDGLADACDGLGGGWTRERALAVMRDARSGPYGVTAIVLVLGLKASVLASLPEGLVGRALVVAAVLGRIAPLLLAGLCPPARPDGAGHAFRAGLGRVRLVAGVLLGGVVAVAVLGAWGGVAAAMTVVGAWVSGAYLRRRLGGFTGDCLGALVEATEALTLTLVASVDFLELA